MRVHTVLNSHVLVPCQHQLLGTTALHHAGTYIVQCVVFPEKPLVTNVTVHVVQCSIGDVTAATGDACQICEKGYYSFNPRNSSCDWCVPNAECPGGAEVLPLPGFWRSSPLSIQMHM